VFYRHGPESGPPIIFGLVQNGRFIKPDFSLKVTAAAKGRADPLLCTLS